MRPSEPARGSRSWSRTQQICVKRLREMEKDAQGRPHLPAWYELQPPAGSRGSLDRLHECDHHERVASNDKAHEPAAALWDGGDEKSAECEAVDDKQLGVDPRMLPLHAGGDSGWRPGDQPDRDDPVQPVVKPEALQQARERGEGG
eukprot:scaffold58608_cov34-Tisochrysis_lutea.AAC.1